MSSFWKLPPPHPPFLYMQNRNVIFANILWGVYKYGGYGTDHVKVSLLAIFLSQLTQLLKQKENEIYCRCRWSIKLSW